MRIDVVDGAKLRIRAMVIDVQNRGAVESTDVFEVHRAHAVDLGRDRLDVGTACAC